MEKLISKYPLKKENPKSLSYNSKETENIFIWHSTAEDNFKSPLFQEGAQYLGMSSVLFLCEHAHSYGHRWPETQTCVCLQCQRLLNNNKFTRFRGFSNNNL